jgi:membrane-associated protease RseP (regulator of RpoE activity)
MRIQFNRMLTLTTAIAAISIVPFASADDTAPTPPSPPETPHAIHGRDVIVVRPDVPGVFVTGQNLYGQGAAAKAKLVKAAFLGVGVSAAPEVLTEQLKLPQGVGLVVEFVEKDSPAEKAGLQARDVLHKLDEQLLVNPSQLATLIRTFKPSDGIKLTVIRKGDIVTLNATLVEKEMPELSANTQAFEFTTPGSFTASVAPFQESLRAQTEKELAERAKARVIRVMPGSTSRIIKVDNGLRIELETKEGKKNLKIAGEDGKSIFEGPYNTEQDIEKVPAEYRDRVKAVEEGIELKEVPATSPAEPKAAVEDLFPAGPKT